MHRADRGARRQVPTAPGRLGSTCLDTNPHARSARGTDDRYSPSTLAQNPSSSASAVWSSSTGRLTVPTAPPPLILKVSADRTDIELRQHECSERPKSSGRRRNVTRVCCRRADPRGRLEPVSRERKNRPEEGSRADDRLYAGCLRVSYRRWKKGAPSRLGPVRPARGYGRPQSPFR